MKKVRLYVQLTSLCFTALCLFSDLYAQNLLANSSFEDINYCQSKIPCCPAAWTSISKYPYGFQNDFDKLYHGKHTIAFLIWSKEKVRTYWQTKLLCNLQKGKLYQLSFYLYSRQTHFQPQSFGAYFSDKQLYSDGDTILELNNYLSINETNISLGETHSWQKIVLSFAANGDEKFLVLGNCKARQIINKGSNEQHDFVEYYLDNISLISKDKTDKSCNEYEFTKDSLHKNNVRHINPNADTLTSIPTSDTSQQFTFSITTDTLILPSVNFSFNSFQLTNTKLLAAYFDKIKSEDIKTIQIFGYTDSIGKTAYNNLLSLKRAKAVKDYLINAYAFDKIQIYVTGKGESIEKGNNEFNRRVEILIDRNKCFKANPVSVK